MNDSRLQLSMNHTQAGGFNSGTFLDVATRMSHQVSHITEPLPGFSQFSNSYSNFQTPYQDSKGRMSTAGGNNNSGGRGYSIPEDGTKTFADLTNINYNYSHPPQVQDKGIFESMKKQEEILNQHQQENNLFREVQELSSTLDQQAESRLSMGEGSGGGMVGGIETRCGYCNAQFDKASLRYAQHLRYYHNHLFNSCELPPFHQLGVDRPTQYACKLCLKLKKNEHDVRVCLELHKKNGDQDNFDTKTEWRCEVPGCNATYNLRKSVMQHGRKIHFLTFQLKKEAFYSSSCDHCKRVFGTRSSLKDHLLTCKAIPENREAAKLKRRMKNMNKKTAKTGESIVAQQAQGIEATAGYDEVALGNEGNSTVQGNEGNSTVQGNEGNSSILGNNGEPTVAGPYATEQPDFVNFNLQETVYSSQTSEISINSNNGLIFSQSQ